jgi:CheY-like chemotaxis protein
MTSDYPARHVLIVDNDKFTRSLIKNVLEDLGFTTGNVYESSDGQDALDLLRSRKVDLIFCAWRMEPMDGVTLVRALRDPEQSPAPGIPVIFCASQIDKKLVEDIREAGVNEAIVKPISASAIESRIRAILKKPRPLVKADAYVGPDRRRVEDENVPSDRRAQKYAYPVKRKKGNELPPLNISKRPVSG